MPLVRCGIAVWDLEGAITGAITYRFVSAIPLPTHADLEPSVLVLPDRGCLMKRLLPYDQPHRIMEPVFMAFDSCSTLRGPMLIPVLGSMIPMCIPHNRIRLIRVIGICASLLTLSYPIFPLIQFDASTASFQFVVTMTKILSIKPRICRLNHAFELLLPIRLCCIDLIMFSFACMVDSQLKRPSCTMDLWKKPMPWIIEWMC